MLKGPWFIAYGSINEVSHLQQLRFFAKDLFRVLCLRRKHLSTTFASILTPCPSDVNQVIIHRTLPLNEPIYVNGRRAVIAHRIGKSIVVTNGKDFEDWENFVTLPTQYEISPLSLLRVIGKFPSRPSEKVITDLLNKLIPVLACEKGNIFILGPDCVLSTFFTDPHKTRLRTHNVVLAPEEAALTFLQTSKILSGKYKGLCYACLDMQKQAFRLAPWIWTNGIIAEALFAYGLDEAAVFLLDTIQPLQQKEGSNAGAWPVRWDIVRDEPQGIVEWYAPNDVAFLAAHGFLSGYKTTGEKKYLFAAEAAANWIIKEGFRHDGQLRLGYRPDKNEWVDDWLYIDAGFTPELFADLYVLTRNNCYIDTASKFIHWFLSKFQTQDGHFIKTWSNSKKINKTRFTRGYAWLLAGLDAFIAVDRDDDHLRRIFEKLIVLVIENQLPSGGWHYTLDDDKTGECAKSTSAFAFFLARSLANDNVPQGMQESVRNAALKACVWCETHQSFEQQNRGYGAIHSWTREGAIVGTRSADVAFTYTNAFYLLARKILKCQ